MSTVGLNNRVLARRVPAFVGNVDGNGSANWQARSIVAFVAVGIAVRLIRYLLRFPLWGDETLLAVNFLNRDFAGLMHPLDCHQVAPLLFLWTELAAVKLLGFNEWSLRLFPLLCSIASLFFFQRLARQLLGGTALVLAVAMFAVSYSGIRYAAEVKPYGVDLMVSTLILLLTVNWWRKPGDNRWLWVLTAATPLVLGLSFPAIFVAGGASLAMAAVLIGRRNCKITYVRPSSLTVPLGQAGKPDVHIGRRAQRGWLGWSIYNVVVATSFLGWYWFGIRAQSQAELGVMTVCWNDAFPPLDSFVKLAAWLLQAHAGALLAVPVGGENWGSTGTLVLCAVAVVLFMRQGRYHLLLLCAAPFALNLMAAALRRYPYGGHMRLTMHLVPIVCILAGAGLAAVLRWRGGTRNQTGNAVKSTSLSVLFVQGRRFSSGSYAFDQPQSASTFTWPVAAVIGLLLMLAAATVARDFYLPGKERADIRKRDFAAWFWGSLERTHEVACTLSDMPATLPALDQADRDIAAPSFLCNERIYSPRHVQGMPCDMARVSAERPLACVQYWSHLEPYDEAAFARWLAAMRQRFNMVAVTHYPLLQDNDNDRQPEPADRVNVYEFVPKG